MNRLNDPQSSQNLRKLRRIWSVLAIVSVGAIIWHDTVAMALALAVDALVWVLVIGEATVSINLIEAAERVATAAGTPREQELPMDQ